MGKRAVCMSGAHGSIAVHQWSADEPRILVALAHGIGEHAARYEHVARRLVDGLGAAVVAPDHRGHGRSAGEPGLVEDVDELMADFAQVVSQARSEHPRLPLVVLGHSLGGLVATRYAQEHPDGIAALVLSGPPIGGNDDIQALLAMDPLPPIPIDPAALSRDPAVGQAYVNDPQVFHGPLDRRTLEAIFGAVARIAAGPALEPFPTLWLHGELDPLAPVAASRVALLRLAPARLEEHIYPGAMHEVFNETNQDEVLGDLVAFLSRELAASKI